MMSYKRLRLLVGLSVLCLSMNAQAYEKITLSGNDTLSELDTFEQYQALFGTPNVFSNSEIKSIPSTVKAISFYRMNDRRNRKMSEHTYTAIEQLIVEKFLKNSRIDVKECLECKTTRVIMAEDRFTVLRRVASNEKLTELSKKIGVDAFLMWDAYVEGVKIFFNARLVAAETGQFLWARQYVLDTESPTQYMFATSLWGLGATRASTTTGGEAQTMNSLLNLSIRTVEPTSLSENVSYGFGLNFFTNPSQRDYFDLSGVAVTTRVTAELDSLFTDNVKPYGNFNIYAGVGEALVSGVPAFMLQGGLELRFNRRQHIDFGFIYMQENDIEFIDATGYETTGQFGGFGYDISIGIKF